MKDLFVTGTDTGVGKTLLSAMLVAALNRKYWKPIQTGACEGTDRRMVMEWANVGEERTHREAFIFDPPVSPHLAAEDRGILIDLHNIRRPEDTDALIIEGAGGILVPVNDRDFMLDLMRRLGSGVVVAARSSLGTINHTLLTVATIRQAGLEVRGVVMIGKENADNRRTIERFGKVPVIGAIPWLAEISRPVLCQAFEQHFEKRAFL